MPAGFFGPGSQPFEGREEMIRAAFKKGTAHSFETMLMAVLAILNSRDSR